MTPPRILLTQGKYTVVDVEDFEYLNQWKWTYSPRGYAIRSDKYGKHIIMHREIMNTPQGMDTDHINGDRLDNRRSNLRICTRAENLANKGLLKRNTSGYKGVAKFRNKWQAYINSRGKRYHIGHFNSAIDAARAYNIKALELHGEFARLNDV